MKSACLVILTIQFMVFWEINSMYIEESIWGYVIMIGIILIGLIYQEIKGIS